MTDRPSPYLDQLGRELVAAGERAVARQAGGRAPARRARRRLGLAAAAVVLTGALTGAVLLNGEDEAAAGVEVAVRGGRVTVTLVDLEHDPGAIESAVRAAGLDVDVRAVPVGPSLVGRFLGAASSRLPEELTVARGGRQAFAGFSLPVGWDGELDLAVGRPAGGDEPYAAPSDAFAPGEPLACSPLLGDTVAVAAARLRGGDLAVRVLPVAAGESAAPVPLAAADDAGLGAWTVAAGVATSRHEVLLQAVDPASSLRPRAGPVGAAGSRACDRP